ncbi:MAG: hydrolase 1, exosortase A system-associated [Pseudomonadota bacterium]
MRRIINFPCGADILAGTLDAADGATGLLIVSGGNEIRSGAFAGQAEMARHMQALGHPVFRFDRRGVGDSEGVNAGFENSAEDITAALAAFRAQQPQLRRIVGFGNCDAAAALALYPDPGGFSAFILANPWTIDAAPPGNAASTPNTAAIRARYREKLRNPRSLLDLLTGRIDMRRLAVGLIKAMAVTPVSGLVMRLSDRLAVVSVPVTICLAARDSTAMAFLAAWKSAGFKAARTKPNIVLETHNTASHSFADAPSRAWLYAQVERVLKQQG